ncbi:trehalose-phosphatase [Sphingosinicella sp. CPCC 101087]|uniref:trehalose-phosphatase n=1 Tax=Sphingosinicella sp. CPCC 101087 TaxID=2497754 RepID=UPI00101B7A98|nr:trehalose-phosphatase [Sphingosinicella sp. CPCC 101087]
MHLLPPPPPDLLDGAALFLDFDGTLVELAETPDSIRVAPELEALLRRLRRRLGGRLAIISGRSIADLERHLPLSGIAFSGSHGLELQLPDGTGLPLSVPVGLEDVHERVRRFASDRPGLLVEEKPAGIALHFRRAPAEAEAVDSFMAALAEERGWSVQRGNMVVELRPVGATKGDALRAFMTEPEFIDARPVFVGDDLTDEHGFDAAADLGGAGVLVGRPRETAATYGLESVAAVAAWLSALA